MKSVLYMAWKYLVAHPFKTVVLVVSIALITYIPVGLRVIATQSRQQLKARAQATPLLVGAKGSPLELALNSLYFNADVPETIPQAECKRIAESGLARAIPLYVRFRSKKHPIVGTTLDYFGLRGLQVESGRQMTRLGDCVVGAEAARSRSVKPGDHIYSSPENVLDLAGVYPLKMKVTGILAPADSPDDHAIFIDIKTAWIIEGLAHGHQDLSKPQAAGQVLKRDGNRVIGNPSVRDYAEVTPENLDSFHFHGDQSRFPITAIIVAPDVHKSGTILMGRYFGKTERCQIIKPVDVVDELMATVFKVQHFVAAALGVVALATLAVAGLVFVLSLRLRSREIETMSKIGGARCRVGAILASEILLVLVLGLLLAGSLTWATSHFGPAAIRAIVMQ